MDIIAIGGRVAFIFIPFLFALCVHEYAHGLVAKWKGDNTAQALGRLTLNPLAHADPIGTFLLPLMVIVTGIPFFFGWAKPVPVDVRSLKNPRSDMFWIALAGPLSNVLMAILAAIVMAMMIRFVPAQQTTVAAKNVLDMFILINLFLAVFNMLPIHPLDGGKVLARFLPPQWNYWLERNQHMTGIVLLVLIFSGVLMVLQKPVMILHSLLTSW